MAARQHGGCGGVGGGCVGVGGGCGGFGGGGVVRYPKTFCTILFYAWIAHVGSNHGAYLVVYGGMYYFFS